MNLIDSHCHLAHARLIGQIGPVLERAKAAGVRAIICPTGDLAEAAAAVKLAAEHSSIYCTAGVHPHEAAEAAPDYLAAMEVLCGNAANVAVGEIGLDYHYDFSPRPAQQRVFAEQLALAARLGKPVVVHTREAFDDTISIIASSGIDTRKIVLHSFTENAACLKRAVEAGMSVSFSGILTFARSQDLQEAARLAPIQNVLVETDAPYLSPEPVRKMKTNEPANVAHVARFLAAIRKVDADDLAEQTSANTCRFFQISPP